MSYYKWCHTNHFYYFWRLTEKEKKKSVFTVIVQNLCTNGHSVKKWMLVLGQHDWFFIVPENALGKVIIQNELNVAPDLYFIDTGQKVVVTCTHENVSPWLHMSRFVCVSFCDLFLQLLQYFPSSHMINGRCSWIICECAEKQSGRQEGFISEHNLWAAWWLLTMTPFTTDAQ